MKNDKYKQARGGWSRMLNVSCENCGQHICFYQKDGSGLLKRIYVDRMKNYSSRANELICTNCNEILGKLITYKKENRPAYRLFVSAVTTKIIKL